MTIIDQKGRLFGKVNLLDLLVVLAVLGAGSWYVYDKFLAPPPPVGNDTVEVTVLVREVREATVNIVQPGLQVSDSRNNAYLGEVIAVRTVPAKKFGDNGEVTATGTFFDHYVTIRGKGNITAASITLGGVAMKVGAEQPLASNVWKGVSVITVIPPLASK
ncbi:MAG TPA: DUF4330 domain-containing protein [Symbiobacteriaceae bacterium]|nr:DUF4330 domain-containing protein [Symbiobacteriaceae bacterium]